MRLYLFLSLFFPFFLLFLWSSAGHSQPVVGRDAAAQYFGERRPQNDEVTSVGSHEHFLGLHIGTHMGTEAYEWGQRGREDDVGKLTYGLTYKFDEWGSRADYNLRIDFNEYELKGEKPYKMSIMPLITFPESSSKFPIYFGAGLGVGVFFKQLKEETPLTLDYQLIIGARFFDVFQNTGFFVETGMKNHLQILTSGQVNGTFLSAGALFTF